jgi:predicted nucleotidyltransferase
LIADGHKKIPERRYILDLVGSERYYSDWAYNGIMPENIKTLLVEFKQGLTIIYGNRLKAVVLFGSYARGDYQEDSDVDVMIVLDTYQSYWEELVRSSQLASDLSLKYGVTVSRTLMTEVQWRQSDWPILRNVRTEGVLA